MRISILIIEDEFTAGNYLKHLILELYPDVTILDIIPSVKESIEWLRSNNEPDLIFMDIHLSDGSSFSIFDSVDIKCPIIFVTAYDQYAIKAFDTNSIGYVLKPIDSESIKKSFEKFLINNGEQKNKGVEDLRSLIKDITKETKHYKQNFLVQIKDKLLTIETSKILYFYTEQKITRAVIYNNEYLLDFSIEDIQNMIHPDAFFRVSRQHIINRNAIQEVTIWFNGKLMIKIKNEANTRIEVSKARVQDFKKWLAM